MSNPRFPRQACLLISLLLAAFCNAPAATVIWTNTAGGNWDNTNNWSPNTIPASGDTVFITNSGTYTVAVNVSSTLASLTVGGSNGTQTLANAGFTLTLDGASYVGTNGVFALDASGVLSGVGDLNVAGNLNWFGGTMTGAGKTIIINGATLTINGAAHRFLHRNLDLRGNGSYTYNGYYLFGGNGALFTIFSGATFDLIGDCQLANSGTPPTATLANNGTLRKVDGAGLAVLSWVVNNASFAQSRSGVLCLIGGGTHTAMFNAQSNGVVNFGGGTHTWTNGTDFTAASGGFHQCDNGTVNVAVPLTINPTFQLAAAGVLAGNADVNFTSTLNWSGGTMVGPGKTVVTNGATLNVNGTAHRFLHRNLDLRGNGAYNYNGYYLYGGNSATFTIFNGATFDLFGDGQMLFSGTGGQATLVNAGTFRKTAGAGVANVGYIVNNTGFIQSQAGVLSLDYGGIVAGTCDASGVTALVNFGGQAHSVTNGANFTVSGGGYHRCNAGTLSFDIPFTFNPTFNLDASGVLAGNADVNFTSALNWSGGTMVGPGKTIVTNAATLNVNGTAHRFLHRNLDLRGNGSYTYNGYYLYGGNSATFTIFNGATFDLFGDGQMVFSGTGGQATLANAGTFRKTAGAGVANVGYIVNNIGFLQSQAGALSLDYGGTVAGICDASGATALVNFGGQTHSVTNGATFTASGGGFHRCNAGTLSFDIPVTFNPTFNLDASGVLAGNADVNFTSTLNWSGGTMVGPGKTIVTNAATLNVNGTAHRFLHRNLDLRGNGAYTYNGYYLYGGNSATFTIFNGAAFDLLGDGQMLFSGTGGQATLVNAGTFRKTSSAGVANVGYRVNNTGVIQSQAGVLSLDFGGTVAGTCDASGATALVNFGGQTHSVTNGANFTASGGGFHRCNAGTLSFDIPFTFNPAFNLDASGVLAGNADVNFTSTVNWSGGTMVGPGKTIVTNSATLNVNGTAHRFLHRNLDLRGAGSYTYNGYYLYGGNSATFTIFNGATFDLLGDGQMLFSGTGGQATLLNAGTFRKTSGAGIANVGYRVNNTGFIQSQAGVLSLDYGGTVAGTCDASGATALVNFGGQTHSVTNGANFTASGGGFHRCNAGTLSFDVPFTFNPTFNLDASGVLAGNADVNFTSTVNWSGGTMVGPGKTIVTNSATLNVNGTAHRFLHRNFDLRGSGAYTYNGYYLYGGNSATFTIFNGAAFDLLGDGQMLFSGTGGQATLLNAGTFRKTSGAGIANVGYRVNNTGVIQSQAGVLSLDFGGTVAGTCDASGATALVNFGGQTHSVTNGANFTANGGGFHRCNAGTLSFDVPFTFNPTFNLDASGVLAGNADVNFTFALNWSGGTMVGPGKTIVTNAATLNVNGTAHRFLHRNLDLRGNGAYTYNGYYLYGGNSATFTIFNGATFDLLGDGQMVFSGTGGRATLVNTGNFRKTSSTGVANVDYACTNTGTIDSQAGTLNFQNTYRQDAGQTLLSGGNYQAVLMDINGGLLTGAGNIAGDVRNAAQVAPGTGVGLMTINDSLPRTYTSTTNSLVTFQIGGLPPGTGHDQISVNGTATLAGTLAAVLANGHVPAPGNAYTVMTFTARSGVFTNFSFPNYDFAVLQTATNIILIASNALPAVSLTGPSNALVCAPFLLQTSATDLDGTVTNLSLFFSNSLVASFPDGAPREWPVTYDFPGPITFAARARDEKGGVRETNFVVSLYTLPLHMLNLGGKQPDGQFKFCMLGESGKNYDALVNTNLNFPSNWTAIGVMENTNGIWRFTDPAGTNFGRRYYRARQQ